MNKLSKILEFIGTTIGANPNTLTTTSKTLVGAINEINHNIDFYYPVGSYYETSNASFDPNVTWGGTWELDSAGRVTVARNASDTAFDTLGETGGSKYVQAHTHSFTQPKIPNHVHSMTHSHNISGLEKDGASGSAKWTIHSSGSDHWGVNSYSGNTGNPTSLGSCTNGAVGAVSGATTGSAGNLQPYIVVNRWHRTA